MTISFVTIRDLFDDIADRNFAATVQSSFGPLLNEFDITVELKLPYPLAPILNNLDDNGKVFVETLKNGLTEYLVVETLQLFVITNYDITSPISKDHDITPTEFIAQVSSQLDKLTDIIITTFCEYVKYNVSYGLNNIYNKELATRVLLQNVSLSNILGGPVNPLLVGVAGSLLGGYFTQGIDYAQDNFYTTVAPFLDVYKVPNWYMSNFDDYIKPVIIHYIEVKSFRNLGVQLPVTPLVFPPSNDPLVNLYINNLGPNASPSEIYVGVFLAPVWNAYYPNKQVIITDQGEIIYPANSALF